MPRMLEVLHNLAAVDIGELVPRSSVVEEEERHNYLDAVHMVAETEHRNQLGAHHMVVAQEEHHSSAVEEERHNCLEVGHMVAGVEHRNQLGVHRTVVVMEVHHSPEAGIVGAVVRHTADILLLVEVELS